MTATCRYCGCLQLPKEQYQYLVMISVNNSLNAYRISLMAQKHSSAVARSIQQLIANGLVETVTGEGKRENILHITALGKKYL